MDNFVSLMLVLWYYTVLYTTIKLLDYGFSLFVLFLLRRLYILLILINQSHIILRDIIM